MVSFAFESIAHPAHDGSQTHVNDAGCDALDSGGRDNQAMTVLGIGL
jgi:hypothetical protein